MGRGFPSSKQPRETRLLRSPPPETEEKWDLVTARIWLLRKNHIYPGARTGIVGDGSVEYGADACLVTSLVRDEKRVEWSKISGGKGTGYCGWPWR